jgi:hypothetical protein
LYQGAISRLGRNSPLTCHGCSAMTTSNSMKVLKICEHLDSYVSRRGRTWVAVFCTYRRQKLNWQPLQVPGLHM